MPTAYYKCGYYTELATNNGIPDKNIPILHKRKCEMNLYTKLVTNWAEIEMGNNEAIVKVEASNSMLDELDGVFVRLRDDLDTNVAEQNRVMTQRTRPSWNKDEGIFVFNSTPQPMKTFDTLNREVKSAIVLFK